MAPRLALAALVLVVLGACGGGSPSAESVVRAWSQALNSGDNERAASLFAPDAEIVQGDQVLRLRTHKDAVAWNAALPCSGRIVSIMTDGDIARATFLLGDREMSTCDGPGQKATAIFTVRKGRITLWHQTSSAADQPPSGTV